VAGDEVTETELESDRESQPDEADGPSLASRMKWPGTAQTPDYESGENDASEGRGLVRSELGEKPAVGRLTQDSVGDGDDGEQQPSKQISKNHRDVSWL